MRFISILLLLTLAVSTWGEVANVDTDTLETKTLYVDVDAMTFFHDNEFDSDIQRGYTLPGAWATVSAQYDPIKNIHLELGIHGAFFNGANKYPNFAYHDVSKWKGNQYQDGVHVLPWFRGVASFGKWSFVLGNIYGAEKHGFSYIMWNPEQTLSADPETGLQVLHNGKIFSADLFINWQSFQFKLDTHQEAFTVGLSSKFKVSKSFSIPLQVLIQHRGGELDDTDDGVQTLCNASLGVEYSKELERGFLKSVGGGAEVLGSYQQAGTMWPFDLGAAFHAKAKAEARLGLSGTLGCFYAPRQFANLYGSPFFSTLSQKIPDLTFNKNVTIYFRAAYSHTFAKHYTFSAYADFFHSNTPPSSAASCFSFGANLHITPNFRIVSFK